MDLDSGLFGLKKTKDPVKAYLAEYTFNLLTKEATERILANDMVEFP